MALIETMWRIWFRYVDDILVFEKRKVDEILVTIHPNITFIAKRECNRKHFVAKNMEWERQLYEYMQNCPNKLAFFATKKR